MYRKAGLLPPINQDSYPRRLIILDTEAYRGEKLDGVELQTYRLGVMRYLHLDDNLNVIKSEYYHTHNPDELVSRVEWYTRKDKCIYLYAHNLIYDLQLSGLLTGLITRGWRVVQCVLDNPPVFARLKRGRMSIVMVDTFNYWQFSVERMGADLGMPKLEMPSPDDDMEAWITYCKRDVDVLSEYLLSFMRFLYKNDLAGLGLTLASQSFRSYRHRFMRPVIELHNNKIATELERRGYAGGRVECFRIGSCQLQPYYYLDVNSMYPYVMRDNLYPVKLAGMTDDLPVGKLSKLLTEYYLIADCHVEVDQPIYALKNQHKLIFPVGSFETTLHSPEIEWGLREGYIERINRIACYEQEQIFTEFVNFFYCMKLGAEKSGNRVLRQQAKLIMNSLYGKFGQLNVISKFAPLDGDYKTGRLRGYSEELGRAVEVNYYGTQVELRWREGESTYSYPAIAGAVTAYARMYLWRLMLTAGLDHVYYVDTDSLIVDQEGYDSLQDYLDPLTLGKLKCEGVSDRLILRGAKDYEFGDTLKHKGIPRKAVSVGEDTWIYEQFRGSLTWLAQGMPTGVEVYERYKRRLSPYDKGILTPAGIVLPLRF